jgi:hypothetical protein
VSSRESWFRRAGSAVPGQYDEDERQPAGRDHGQRATDEWPERLPGDLERPAGESARGDDRDLLALRDSTDEPRRGRARTRGRDRSPSARWKESAPPPEQLGEDDYWSYLRGDGGHPASGGDAARRDDPVDLPRARSAATDTSRPEPTETWRPEPAEPTWLAEPAESAEPTWLAEPTGPRASVAEPLWQQPSAVESVTGQQPVLGAERPPASKPSRRSNRGERVRPGIALPAVFTVFAALGWIAVVAYGVFRLDVLWSLVALVAGGGALALGLRGRSIVGLVPVLAGAAAWGMATVGQAPASPTDIVGDLRLVVWNALYAAPLLVAFGFATWLDATGSARDRVRAVLADRRWWGGPDAPDAEPRVAELEDIPSARFFQLTTGSCPHLITAGRRVALIRSTVWPRGAYTATAAGEVHRDGRHFIPGAGDLSGVVADVRTWIERLEPETATVAGFLVVHPASGRPGDRVEIDIPQTGGVQVVTAEEFLAAADGFLTAEPYRLDVALTERLGEHLPIFDPRPA